MRTMEEIYSKINAHYRQLRAKHDDEAKTARNELYSMYPRIEEIDREISTLAISSARRILEEKISAEEATASMQSKADKLREERAKIFTDFNISEYKPKYECDICHDTGRDKDGNKCRCYINRMRSMITLPGERINQNSEFFKSSVFEKFKLSYYPDIKDASCGFVPRKMMQMNYARCLGFANDFTPGKSENILLYGPSGLGKSFMAASIYNRVSEKGYYAMYKSSYALFQFLEDYKFGRVDRDEYSLCYDSIYDCDLLIIDDFGTEFINSYTQSVFFDLLNTRLINGKSMVISTNLTFDKLKEIYQDRVCSRLQNEFTSLFFCGEDIRNIKSNEK